MSAAPSYPRLIRLLAAQYGRNGRNNRLNDSTAASTLVLDARAAGHKLTRREAKQLIAAERNGDIDVVSPDPPASDAPALTWRTLADVDDSPPGELVLGMLEPDGPTMLYGAGGVGKGTTIAWIIAECLPLGIRSMVYDAEGHPREWRRRTAGLGVDPSQVVYRQPHELPDHLLGRPLHDVVPHLGDIARAADCGLLIVDSVIAASNLSEDGLKGDARAPYRYVAALSEIGIPSVSIGHTTKGSREGEPYGSVAWVNAMRLTWLGTCAEGEGHRIRWTPRKRNERGAIPGVLLTCSYDESGRLCHVAREDDEQAIRTWLKDALRDGPRTVEDLADEMADMSDGPPNLNEEATKSRLRQALARMRRVGLVHKTGGRGAPWALGQDATHGRA